MKRLISLLIMLCLMVSMFSLSAYAGEYMVNDPEAFALVINEAEDVSTIMLGYGEFTLPDNLGSKRLLIKGAGAENTTVKLPADYVDNGLIKFENLSTKAGNSTTAPSAPKTLLYAPAPLSSGTVVAKIGDAEFESIQAAFIAASSGDVIKVVASHSVDASNIINVQSGVDTLLRVSGKSCTLDLNGCTVTAAVGSTELYALISVTDGGHLTLCDNAGSGSLAVDVDDSSIGLSNVFWCSADSTLNIQSGSYYVDCLQNAGSFVYSSGSETVSVSGGNFHLANVGTGDNGSPWMFNAKGGGERHVHVSGGTYNVNVLNQFWRFEVQEPNDGYLAMQDNGDGTYTVVKQPVVIQREKEGAYYYPAGYDSLDKAVEAANNITLSSDKGTTIIGNAALNKSVTAKKQIAVEAGKSVSLTLKANLAGETGSDGLISIPAGSVLTVNGEGSITNNGLGSFADIFGENVEALKGKLIINGGTWAEDPTPFLAPGAKATLIAGQGWVVTPSVPAAPAVNAATKINSYDVPATADNSNMPLWCILLAVFAVTALLTGKKRRS